MPTPVLNAYAEQLPRLSAEESLLAANRVAVGSGSLRKGEGNRIASAWARETGQQRASGARSKGPGEYAARMAALGIGVKREPKVPPDG